MKKKFLGIVSLLVFSCNPNPESSFSLTGKTIGINDGTVLYLETVLSKLIMDSTTVEINSFIFKTKLDNFPVQVVLRTKDFSHYRFLWLEKNSMTFDASSSNFRNAIVTGSESEDLLQGLLKEIDTLSREEKVMKEVQFVKDNPNSLVSAYILSVYSTTWGKEKTSKLFEGLSDQNKNSEYGQKIKEFIKLNIEPTVGEYLVDFEMTDIHGDIKKLSDLTGKTILLEFWASWCKPCREENPNLVKTYKKFKPKGFEIFAVSLDENKNSWIKAIEKDSLDWIHVSDLKGSQNSAVLIYGVSGIPDNFLINKEGKIVYRNIRGDKLNESLIDILQ